MGRIHASRKVVSYTIELSTDEINGLIEVLGAFPKHLGTVLGLYQELIMMDLEFKPMIDKGESGCRCNSK